MRNPARDDTLLLAQEALQGHDLAGPVSRAGAHARVEPGVTRRERRYLRLDVREFAVGRQGLPAVLLRILLDPRTLGVLRWPLPDSIEAITIEPGRVVIRLAS